MFKIKNIETYIIQVPLLVPLKMSGVHIEHCDNTVVKITANNGKVGWGRRLMPLFLTAKHHGVWLLQLIL